MSNAVKIATISVPETKGSWEVRQITFEGDDKTYEHYYNTGSDYPFNLTEGMDCVYSSLTEDKGVHKVKGLKPANAGSGGGGKKGGYGKSRYGGSPDVQRAIIRQSSLSNAVNYLTITNPGGNVDLPLEKVLSTASLMEEWVTKALKF